MNSAATLAADHDRRSHARGALRTKKRQLLRESAFCDQGGRNGRLATRLGSGQRLNLGTPATSRSTSSASWLPVRICGQRRQAARPSWRNQRQSRRMLQAGSWSTTSGSILAILTASWQSTPSKCVHLRSSQRADRRNTWDTSSGAASSSTGGGAGGTSS